MQKGLSYKDVYIVTSLSLILTLLFPMPESQCSTMLAVFLILQKLFWFFLFFPNPVEMAFSVSHEF